jgi:hypothetical protein
VWAAELGPLGKTGRRELTAIRTFREVLKNIDNEEEKWIFLPEKAAWSLESPCGVLALDEILPDSEDEGIPQFAVEHELMLTLQVADAKSIKENILLQKGSASTEEVFEAFCFYYDHDAFMVFGSPGRS